ILELFPTTSKDFSLNSMLFSPNSLDSRSLCGVTFSSCHFQPTLLKGEGGGDIHFKQCEFERIELTAGISLSQFVFEVCRIDSLVTADSEYIFDPLRIRVSLELLGARFLDDSVNSDNIVASPDQALKVLEKFLRIFLRTTY